jgi:hypothetical protein
MHHCTLGITFNVFPQRDTDEEVKEHLRHNLHLQEKVTLQGATGPCCLLAAGLHTHVSCSVLFVCCCLRQELIT